MRAESREFAGFVPPVRPPLASFFTVWPCRPSWRPASSISPAARRHPPRPASCRRPFLSPHHRTARLLRQRRKMQRRRLAHRHQYPTHPAPPLPHVSPRVCPSSTFRRTTPARRHSPTVVRWESTPNRPTTPSCTMVCFLPDNCSIHRPSIRCGTTTGTANGRHRPGMPPPTRSAIGTFARRALPGM